MGRTNIGVLGMIALAGSAAASVVVWDPTPDFSIDYGNPNGVWSYGWMEVGFGALNLYENSGITNGNPQWWAWGGDRTPCVWKNMHTDIWYGVEPGQISLHPGNGHQPSVVRWTTPTGAEGRARIDGRFFNGDIGGMTVGVLLNGTLAWEAFNSGAFELSMFVHPGDTVDFAVYGGYGYGNTPLAVEIRIGDECLADFDADGFVTGADFDLFVRAFESGDMGADFDGDGFITGVDFDEFVEAFEAGC